MTLQIFSLVVLLGAVVVLSPTAMRVFRKDDRDHDDR